MSIHFYCPLGHRLVVPDEREGKKGRCPVCHQKVYVPVADPRPSGRKKEWPEDLQPSDEPRRSKRPPKADDEIDEIVAEELGLGETPGLELDAPRTAEMFRAPTDSSKGREPSSGHAPPQRAEQQHIQTSRADDSRPAQPTGGDGLPTFDFDLPPPTSTAKPTSTTPKPAATVSKPAAPPTPHAAYQPSAGYGLGPPPVPKSRNDGLMPFEPITRDTFAPKSYDRPSGPWFRSVRPGMAVAAMMPEWSLLQHVYLVAASLIAMAMLGATPALLHLSSEAPPAWGGAALLLSAIEVLIALWIVSIPDTSTLWVGMLVAALGAAAYGATMAAVVATPIGRSPPLDLFEVRHTAGAWCGVNMVLHGAICYVLGRSSQSWQWRRR